MSATLNGYQNDAMRCHDEGPVRLVSYALGLTGESGEVADLVKKHIGHGHPLDDDKLKLELGDVLWYIAGLAYVLGFTLQEVADANTAKLMKRFPNGFTTEASIARQDENI